MKIGLGLTVLAGLVLAVMLITQQGAGADAVTTVGWGIVLLAAFHFLPLTCSALGWRAVLRYLVHIPAHAEHSFRTNVNWSSPVSVDSSQHR